MDNSVLVCVHVSHLRRRASRARLGEAADFSHGDRRPPAAEGPGVGGEEDRSARPLDSGPGEAGDPTDPRGPLLDLEMQGTVGMEAAAAMAWTCRPRQDAMARARRGASRAG